MNPTLSMTRSRRAQGCGTAAGTPESRRRSGSTTAPSADSRHPRQPCGRRRGEQARGAVAPAATSPVARPSASAASGPTTVAESTERTGSPRPRVGDVGAPLPGAGGGDGPDPGGTSRGDDAEQGLRRPRVGDADQPIASRSGHPLSATSPAALTQWSASP